MVKTKLFEFPMDESMKKYIEEFLELCYERLDKGEQDKKDAYTKIDLYQQIIEELADVSNYAFLEYVKIRNLKELKNKIKK